MSARQWKPGDVASITFDNASKVRRSRGESNVITRIAIFGDRGWGMGLSDGLTVRQINDPELKAIVRPLVVIDPEDREQVERLTGLIYNAATDRPYVGGAADGVQAALHSLIQPPKPDEPQGLGAVVLDDRGVPWIRTEPEEADCSPWTPSWTNQGNDHQPAEWDEISVARVLSEGWSE